MKCGAREPVEATTFEFDILETLMRSAGRVVSRDELMEELYGRKATPFDRSVDMHISHLRKKLESRQAADQDGARRRLSVRAIRRKKAARLGVSKALHQNSALVPVLTVAAHVSRVTVATSRTSSQRSRPPEQAGSAFELREARQAWETEGRGGLEQDAGAVQRREPAGKRL